MVGEQLYGFKKIQGMLEMLQSPVMKTLSAQTDARDELRLKRLKAHPRG